MTFREYAFKVLKESNEPLKVAEITKRALEKGLTTKGKAPIETMRGVIEWSITRDPHTPFLKYGPGKYGLR
jgi:predicted Zn-ribbon and HTH transcriptional regulator